MHRAHKQRTHLPMHRTHLCTHSTSRGCPAFPQPLSLHGPYRAGTGHPGAVPRPLEGAHMVPAAAPASSSVAQRAPAAHSGLLLLTHTGISQHGGAKWLHTLQRQSRANLRVHQHCTIMHHYIRVAVAQSPLSVTCPHPLTQHPLFQRSTAPKYHL